MTHQHEREITAQQAVRESERVRELVLEQLARLERRIEQVERKPDAEQ